MPLNKLVRFVALFWGLVVFMPVGVNYLAFFALIACMLALGGRMERLRRVRQHALFWPLAAYVLWTILILISQPVWYAETPSNLWHGTRIVLTLALALALRHDEALWAMRGFLLATAFSLLIVAAHFTLGLPELPVWRNLIEYLGNKSISNAVLMSLVAGSALVLAWACAGWVRPVAIAAALMPLCVIVFVLPNRTALLVVLFALPVAAIHRWRGHKRRLLAFVLVAALVSTVFVTGVPAVRTRLAQGMGELEQAAAGTVARASWNLRVQMARHTTRMVLERPWMGWGIGGWNDQWRKRAPPLIADLNMPHNDFLWMGAQAGLPGALSWLAIMLVACRAGWRRRDLPGRLAFVAALSLLLIALLNSATRDGVIGLSLLWIVGLYLRLASEPGFSVTSLLKPPAGKYVQAA